VVLAAAMTAESRGQTTYYYPSSMPAVPTVTAPATAASTSSAVPQYYHYRTWLGRVKYRVIYTQPAQEAYAPAPSPTAAAGPAANTPAYQETGYVAEAPPTSTGDNTKPAPEAKDNQAGKTGASKEEATDPYGFTAWLNATRAAYGLAPVGYDPNLSSWAASNNEQQAIRGLGHFVMGPATRQNAAVGAYPGIETMWMNSPAHRAALLDPTIRWIGIAGLGAYWTFNAN